MSALVGACGHANEVGLRFCTQCGQPLVSGCPSCGAAATPGQRFCGHCGTPLAAPAAPGPEPAPDPAGERKQVTVLFVDVARSMELSERLDPDAWTEIMQGLFAVCRTAVESFGGTVDKFTGDGVMALFGAPVAQEDHAQRAAHAALRLLDAASAYAGPLQGRGIDLTVRVGLNSGEVVAGSVGEAFTAIGHTVGLAQRMESLAEPGTVRLSEHTAGLLGGSFGLRDLGLTEVKGATRALRVFALDGAAGGASAPGRRKLGVARLVGRDDEFAILHSALVAATQGRAQVVGVVGEAGAGKSRLCEEVARRATELGVTVRRTAGVSHGRSVPLLPILGFLRDYFGIADTDSAAQARERIADRLLGLDPELETELPLLFDFLEVPDPDRPAPQLGPDTRRRRVLEVFRRATTKRSEQQTLLLVMEDLHWFDPHSVEFLDAWLPSFPGTRTMILTNFRPEFHAPWMGSSSYRQIPLAPLDGVASVELFDELLGSDPSLGALAGQLRARAGGNPFFIEEIVRGLAADGTLVGSAGAYRLARPDSELRVPATVQVVLADRIDRQTARDKAVLQAASVIGRTFATTVLAAAVDLSAPELQDALQVLCAAELLQRTAVEGEYRFWHPLTQEVAYGGLLTATRRRLHQRVGEALIASGPDRHDELAAVLAGHFEAAGDHWSTAQWQIRAGVRAMRRDWTEAIRRMRIARAQLEALEESPEVLTARVKAAAYLVRMLARVGDLVGESDGILAEIEPVAERLGDLYELFMLSVAAGSVRFLAGQHARAAESWRRLPELAQQSGAADLRGFATFAMALDSAWMGNVVGGRRAVADCMREAAGDVTLGTTAIGYSAHDAALMADALLALLAGDLNEAATQALPAARRAFDERPVAEWRAWVLTFPASLADLTGELTLLPSVRADGEEALQIALDSGNTPSEAQAGEALGLVALLEGRAADAAGQFEQVLVTARSRGAGLNEARVLAQLARAHLALGDAAAARATADEAVEVARRQAAPVLECFAHLVRARVLRATGIGEQDMAQARSAVAEGKRFAHSTGAVTYLPFFAEETARLDGDRSALKTVADAYDAIGATGHARRLREELGG